VYRAKMYKTCLGGWIQYLSLLKLTLSGYSRLAKSSDADVFTQLYDENIEYVLQDQEHLHKIT